MRLDGRSYFARAAPWANDLAHGSNDPRAKPVQDGLVR